jgi:ABC-type uncharacterized transport system permease subunit
MLDFALVQAAVLAFAAAFGLGFESVRRGRAGLMTAARVAAGVGVLVATAALLRRGGAMGAFPIVSRYETHLFIAAVVGAIALVLDLARRLPILTLAASPISFLSLLIGALLGAPEGAPAAVTQSPWAGLHVLAVLTAYGAFAMAFVAGLLFLIEQRELKAHAASTVLGAMPSLETFRRLTVGAVGVGLALLTAGIVVGYLYARRALQPGWRMDAKVWSATLTWAVYIVVLAMSFVPAFKGRRTAMASVAGFVVVMGTFWVAAFWSNFHRFL